VITALQILAIVIASLILSALTYRLGRKDWKRHTDKLASDLVFLARSHEDLTKSRDIWKAQADKWRRLAVEESVKKPTPEAARELAKLEDPPTVGEADRRAVASGRDRGRPLGVRDREFMPVPQLREAEDDN
jgi:hypothetical protein